MTVTAKEPNSVDYSYLAIPTTYHLNKRDKSLKIRKGYKFSKSKRRTVRIQSSPSLKEGTPLFLAQNLNQVLLRTEHFTAYYHDCS